MFSAFVRWVIGWFGLAFRWFFGGDVDDGGGGGYFLWEGVRDGCGEGGDSLLYPLQLLDMVLV